MLNLLTGSMSGDVPSRTASSRLVAANMARLFRDVRQHGVDGAQILEGVAPLHELSLALDQCGIETHVTEENQGRFLLAWGTSPNESVQSKEQQVLFRGKRVAILADCNLVGARWECRSPYLPLTDSTSPEALVYELLFGTAADTKVFLQEVSNRMGERVEESQECLLLSKYDNKDRRPIALQHHLAQMSFGVVHPEGFLDQAYKSGYFTSELYRLLTNRTVRWGNENVSVGKTVYEKLDDITIELPAPYSTEHNAVGWRAAIGVEWTLELLTALDETCGARWIVRVYSPPSGASPHVREIEKTGSLDAAIAAAEQDVLCLVGLRRLVSGPSEE